MTTKARKTRMRTPRLYIPTNYVNAQDYEAQFNRGNNLVPCAWIGSQS